MSALLPTPNCESPSNWISRLSSRTVPSWVMFCLRPVEPPVCITFPFSVLGMNGTRDEKGKYWGRGTVVPSVTLPPGVRLSVSPRTITSLVNFFHKTSLLLTL